MTLPNPTVTMCMRCLKIIRDERPTPHTFHALHFDVCATCRVEIASTNEIQNRVGHPPVKADLPPSLPSSTAAASPVPDLSRDGIFLADDDGDSLVFDVRLVMTARTRVEDGARISTGRTELICGGTKPVAWLEGVIGGEPRIYGQLAEELVKAIEAEIAARQPRKGDEK